MCSYSCRYSKNQLFRFISDHLAIDPSRLRTFINILYILSQLYLILLVCCCSFNHNSRLKIQNLNVGISVCVQYIKNSWIHYALHDKSIKIDCCSIYSSNSSSYASSRVLASSLSSVSETLFDFLVKTMMSHGLGEFRFP